MLDEQQVRSYVYDVTARSGRPPSSGEVAESLGATPEEVLAAFQRLRSRKLLAVAPDSGEIVMAPPFSATPTPFRVTSDGREYFGNCVWDAYGIAAALHRDVTIEASCACCGEPMRLAVEGGKSTAAAGVAHFAVPAAHWWDDLTYT